MSSGAPTTRSKFTRLDSGGIMTATWLLSVPWAHPVWSEYVIFAYDLHHVPGRPAAVRLSVDVTHEFMLCALSPDHRIKWDKPFVEQSVVRLSPANHGYQLKIGTDEAANLAFIRRLDECVKDIKRGTLSPDTDFRAMWDERFQDGLTLLKSAYQPDRRLQ